MLWCSGIRPRSSPGFGTEPPARWGIKPRGGGGGGKEGRARRSDLAAHLEDDGSHGAPSSTTVMSGKRGAVVPSAMGRLMKCSGGKRQGCVFSQRGCRPTSCPRQSHKQPLFYSGSQINIRRPKKWLGLRKKKGVWTQLLCRFRRGRASEVSFAGLVFCCVTEPRNFPLPRIPIFALGWLFLSLVPVFPFKVPPRPSPHKHFIKDFPRQRWQ